MTKLNVKLLERVKAHILAKPTRFVMRSFVFYKKENMGATFPADCTQKPVRFAECGTAACIGGWAVLLGSGRNAKSRIRSRATAMLGIEPGTEDLLFEWTQWPTALQRAYGAASTQTERAKIAARRIDAYIQEHADRG